MVEIRAPAEGSKASPEKNCTWPRSYERGYAKLAPRAGNGRVVPPSFPPARMITKVSLFGLWLSLVERAVRVGEVQGSNPCSPTIIFLLMVKHLRIDLLGVARKAFDAYT